MTYNDFEKHLYKSLFEKFANEEYHVEYSRSTYPDDFEQLRAALRHLSDGGIIFLLADEDDELCAELTPGYCFKFVEI